MINLKSLLGNISIKIAIYSIYCVGIPLSLGAQQDQLLLSPKAYYPLDNEASQTSGIYNKSIESRESNPKSGTFHNLTDRFGNTSGALGFSLDSRIKISSPFSSNESLEGYSVSFWVKVSYQNEKLLRQAFYVEDVNHRPLCGVGLNEADGSLYISRFLDFEGSRYNTEFTPWGPVEFSISEPSHWYHVILVYEKNMTRIYFGKKEESLHCRASYFYPQNLSGGKWFLGNLTLHSNVLAVEGLDDFKIYSGALSNHEVHLLHDMESGIFNPHIAYKIVDYSGNSINAKAISKDILFGEAYIDNDDRFLWRMIKTDENPEQYLIFNEANLNYFSKSNFLGYGGGIAIQHRSKYSSKVSFFNADEYQRYRLKISGEYMGTWTQANQSVYDVGGNKPYTAGTSSFKYYIIPVKYTVIPEGEHIIRQTDMALSYPFKRTLQATKTENGMPANEVVNLNDYNPDKGEDFHVSFSTNNDDLGYVIFTNKTKTTALEVVESSFDNVRNKPFNASNYLQRWYIQVVGYDGFKPKYRIISKQAIYSSGQACTVLGKGVNPTECDYRSSYTGPNNWQNVWNIQKVLFDNPLENINGNFYIKIADKMLWAAHSSKLIGYHNLYLHDAPEVSFNVVPSHWRPDHRDIFVASYTWGRTSYKNWFLWGDLGIDDTSPIKLVSSNVQAYSGAFVAQWTGYDNELNPYYRLKTYSNHVMDTNDADPTKGGWATLNNVWGDTRNQRWQLIPTSSSSSNLVLSILPQEEIEILDEVENRNSSRDNSILKNNIKENAFTMYPNPTGGELNISLSDIELSEKIETEVSIFNLMGKKVHSFKDRMMPGAETRSYNIDALSSGIYLVSIRSHDKDFGSQILVVNK